MSIGRTEWPEIGELVIATVKDIKGYGAYVTLDEYMGKEGLLHISEISSRWVRNIRNHVRIGQKVVLQVLRVDQSRGQIDLSLRRVSRDDKRKKIESWKKTRKAETLLTSAAQNLDLDVEELYQQEGVKILEFYGSLYKGLEEAAKVGIKALTQAGVSEDIAKSLAEIAEEKIVVKRVTIQGLFEISSHSRRGVEDIKELFGTAIQIGDEKDADINVYTLGAPKYRMEVTADNYKDAEIILDEIVTNMEEIWTDQEGGFNYNRE
jgi:translation initiation factor 2 subunit 1